MKATRSAETKCSHNRLPAKLVRRMYADYRRLGSMPRAAALHGRNGATLHGIFRSRGLKTLGDRGERTGRTRRKQLDDVVARMHADYQTGLSLSEVGRRHGNRSHKTVRGLFVLRGLPVRPCRGGPVHLANGQFKPRPVLSEAQIDGIIARMTKLHIPKELLVEWRDWPIERRGDFIARVRARVKLRNERPTTPFSKNVVPFDYTTPRARMIAAKINHGLNSRDWKIKIDLNSQGVIWDGKLWFWVGHNTGYVRGPWTPEHGRPALHHVLWEKRHGRPVPKSHVVRFADGNWNNLDPANLVLATRNELCRENQAAALSKKAREITTLLLNRHTRKEKTHGLLESLKA